MNSQSAYERWLLARIAGPSAGTFSAPCDARPEDHPQPGPEGHPLQEPVEHRRPSQTCRARHRPSPRSLDPAGRVVRRPARHEGRAVVHNAAHDDPPPRRRRSRSPRPPRAHRRPPHRACCSATASPARPHSMKPWGECLAEQGYAVEVPRLPGHGTTWQELNTTALGPTGTPRLTRALRRGSPAANDAVVVGGLSMGGALVLRLAADHADRGRRRRAWSTRPSRTKRLDVKAAAGAQARGAVVPGHRQRHQEARRRRARLHRGPRSRPAHSMIRGLAAAGRGPAEGHRAAALLPLHRRPRRRRARRSR